MAFVKPLFTNAEINRAGKILASDDAGPIAAPAR
jgi:hypothetical protein